MQQQDVSLPRIIVHAYRRGRDRGLDMVTQQRLAVAAVRAVRPDLEEIEVVSMVERQEDVDLHDGGAQWNPPLPDPLLAPDPLLSLDAMASTGVGSAHS